MVKKVYTNKKVFLIVAVLSSLATALMLALPKNNLTTQIPEISIDFLMLWGLPLIPTVILQAGHQLTEKTYPDRVYIGIFSLFWFVFATSQLLAKVL